MTGTLDGKFPDLPQVPALPHPRPQNSTLLAILSEAAAGLRAALDAVHQVGDCSRPGQQLASIRSGTPIASGVRGVLGP